MQFVFLSNLRLKHHSALLNATAMLGSIQSPVIKLSLNMMANCNYIPPQEHKTLTAQADKVLLFFS